MSVELVIIVPALVIMLGLIIAGGRLWFARTIVTEAAYSAARAAALARSPGQATESGQGVAYSALQTQGLDCASRSVQIDTGDFAKPVGQPGTITSQVTCKVAFADILLPGMPGSITVSGAGSAALDTYRER